jgi:hypothetical protein
MNDLQPEPEPKKKLRGYFLAFIVLLVVRIFAPQMLEGYKVLFLIVGLPLYLLLDRYIP